MSIIPILLGSEAKASSNPFTLQDAWDPFGIPSFSSLQVASISGNRRLSLDNVQVDWKETPTSHVFKADLPGLQKEEVKVEVEEKRFLKISGERVKEAVDKDDKWHRVGRSFGKFVGTIPLPDNATVGTAKAVLENGVLTITVPKEKDKVAQIRVIAIQ